MSRIPVREGPVTLESRNLHAQVPGAIALTREGIPTIARAIAADDEERAAAETRTMPRALARRGIFGAGEPAPITR
jgi:hypothetical protein